MSVATTKPIEATSMDGDFVLRSQELAKSEGFGNVSKIWYEKTQPISLVVEEAIQHASRAETVSRTLDAIAATVDSQGNFRIRDRISGQDWIPAKHVIGQLGNVCGIGSAYPTLLFQKGTPSASELLTRVFNFHLGCKPTKGRRFNLRLRNKQRLSGIVSENSSVVENAWYLKVLQRLVPDGRISHWKSDEDSILGNLLISDTMRKESDSEYGAMLSLRSSEVQVYRFCQRPSLFRAICMNGCIWGQTKGQALTSWGRSVILQHDIASAIEKNLTEQIPLCTEQLDRFLMTRHFETTMAMKPVVAQLCLEQRLNKVISAAVLSGWNVERAVAGETAPSLFGLINGVTRAAQEMDVNGWYKLDELGGTLLEFNADRWEAMVTRAAKLSMKDVESTFGHWAYSRT